MSHDNEIAISVIIYASDKLEGTFTSIGSLECQMTSRAMFEALVIFDKGDANFTDFKSLDQIYGFLRVIECDSEGIISGYNTGIANAKGQFITFLRAGDYYSETTIANLCEFISKLKRKTDVITFPLLREHLDSGKQSSDGQERWFKESRTYYVDEVPYIALSTENVCIRKSATKGLLFDSNAGSFALPLFITEALACKHEVSFDADAQYHYVVEQKFEEMLRKHPYFDFDGMVYSYKKLLELGDNDLEIRRYAHHTILHDVNQRIRSDYLYPRHMTGSKRNEADRELASIFKRITVREYSESPHLNEYHAGYLLKEYLCDDITPLVKHSPKRVVTYFQDGQIWRSRKVMFNLERFVLDGSRLLIRGRFTCPAFIFEGEPALTIKALGEEINVPINSSSFDYASAHVKTTRCWSISTVVDISELKNQGSIVFSLSIGNNRSVPLSITMKPRVHNARFFGKKLLFNGLVVETGESRLKLSRHMSHSLKKDLAVFSAKHPRAVKRRMDLKRVKRQLSNKRVWLYSDLPTVSTGGNALALLLHDLKKKDGIDRYYISNFENELVEQYPELEGKVVKCKSIKHKHYSLFAEMIFASFIERFTFMPYSQATYDQLGDLRNPQRLVYLQHGILHAHIPWYFSFDRLPFDYEVVSTNSEIRNLVEYYHFPPEVLIDAGAPRFDQLTYGAAQGKKKILYAPSWRSYLVAGKSDERLAFDQHFIKSSFYKGLNSFVKKIADSGILERYGYQLELKLHPNLLVYKHLFNFDFPNVSLAQENIDEDNYGIIITDFSSYVYDFVYVGSSVVYYVPDIEAFNAGLNHYWQLDIPYEEGFGPLCTEASQAIEAVESIIQGNDDSRPYRARREKFFIHTEGRNSERVYKASMEIADSLHVS